MSTKAHMVTDAEAMGNLKVRRALITVSDKRGVAEFAAGLAELGTEILSTGGTATAIRDAGVEVTDISAYTGFPEMLGGRVKTLHPRIHAGLLAVRSDEAHVRALAEQDIEPIDLVCVNLYPFEETARQRGVSDAEVIEQIDIGGPTLVRAAAKNHAFCAVVVKPESYDAVLAELGENGGEISAATREALAVEAFALTARYDAKITTWFGGRDQEYPDTIIQGYEKVLELSYGENPHQRAAYYADAGARSHLLSMVAQVHGKPISLNNLLDLNSGRTLLEEFTLPAVAVLKHNNPCGCAVAATASEAYARALACDPLSAFGGVVCANREVDSEFAARLNENFVELVFAPGYTEEALGIIEQKRNIRILRDDEQREAPRGDFKDMRRVIGGMLIQDLDSDVDDRDTMTIVTKSHPTEEQWGDLLFAWRVAKHVRSNAIVLAKELATVGIGAGQTSRVDAVRFAIEKAEQPLEGSVMASDAFFPFADGPLKAIEAGVAAIIQPGGSKRDPEVIEVCEKHGVPMVFTHRRHFRH